MEPLEIIMFCAQAAGQANEPGQSIKMVALNGVQGKLATGDRKAEASPNALLFKEGSGNVQLNLANLASDTFKGFEEGRRYKVTVEEVTV